MRRQKEINDLTKDQRTIFVSQLTKKVTERHLEDFFSQVGPVKNIIMLRDKASGAHKGFAYVEMLDLDSIPNCLLFNNVVPDFQKFAILVKASEAEKNFLAKKEGSATDGNGSAGSSNGGPRPDCRVYVGNLAPEVSEGVLRPVLEQLGIVESIKLFRDHLGNSKGFAFVAYTEPSAAQLALAQLGGADVMGRPLKVGPVIDQSQKAAQMMNAAAAAQSSAPPAPANLGVTSASTGLMLGSHGVVPTGTVGTAVDPTGAAAFTVGSWKLDSDEGRAGLTLDGNSRIALMAKLGQSAGLHVPLPPQAAPAPPAGPAGPAAAGGGASQVGGIPSIYLLICNMFDPATETDPEWELDIKEDVAEECSKFGPVEHIHVETQKPGGIVLIKFKAVEAAIKTAHSMNGRFFAGRSLTASFLAESTYRELLQ